jgi:ATP-dependent exoDNAse (exonuclease V) alpha subunit
VPLLPGVGRECSAKVPRFHSTAPDTTNRSLLGARNLNQVLQAALNPDAGGPEVQRFGWTFRTGDPVIQTENDYNRDVFNGDLGVIEKINRIDQGPCFDETVA